MSIADCRLLIDPPARGEWNMAVDDLLLAMAAKEELPTLRFYRWKVPTLSLGYFQIYADRDQHAASRDVSLVRRASGGGAILHDDELTYSLALPSTHRLARRPQPLVDAVHGEIAELFHQQIESLTAAWQSVRCHATSFIQPCKEPFLCFQRRAQGDLLLRSTTTPHVDHKMVGSAQRRRRGAVLQHGSILLGQSEAAPELPGIAELVGSRWAPDEIVKELLPRLLRILSLSVRTTELPNDVTDKIKMSVRQKFGKYEWTRRR